MAMLPTDEVSRNADDGLIALFEAGLAQLKVDADGSTHVINGI